MAEVLNAQYWLKQKVNHILPVDFNEGMRDALLDESLYKGGNAKEALKWLEAQIKENRIDNKTYDAEFKKILKDLNKAEKNGEEIAKYRPAVKKAIMKFRRAINYHYSARIFFKGYRGHHSK